MSIREWARTLGWPEGRQEPAVRLRIFRCCPGHWRWRITTPPGECLDSDFSSTQAQALAVGLAALDTAHARTAR